jgi:hypothetical protein
MTSHPESLGQIIDIMDMPAHPTLDKMRDRLAIRVGLQPDATAEAVIDAYADRLYSETHLRVMLDDQPALYGIARVLRDM